MTAAAEEAGRTAGLDAATRQRVLSCLLLSQRHSWDQGLVAAVLEQTGAAAALTVRRELPTARCSTW